MSGQTFESALHAYWAAVGNQSALPELPEEPFDAFVELLHLTSEAKQAFRLAEFSDDPYPGLSVGDTKKPWQERWALQLSDLEPFELPAERDVLFLVDSVPDPKGNHRVYTFADGVRGAIAFADLTSALSWMAVRVRSARDDASAAELETATATFVKSLRDLHEESTNSGFYVFEKLLDAPFPEAWSAYSNGAWVVPSSRVESFRLLKNGGWERRLSLYLVQRFLERRIVDLPKSIKPTELGAAHRGLVKHLQAFEEAMHTSIVPEIIDDVAASSDKSLAKLAVAWTERYESSRGDLDDGGLEGLAIDEDAPSRGKLAAGEPAKKGSSTKGMAMADDDSESTEKPAKKAAAKKGAAKKTAAKAAPAKKAASKAGAAKAGLDEPNLATSAAPAKATSVPAKKGAAPLDDELDDFGGGDDDDDDDFDDLDEDGDEELALPPKRPKSLVPETPDTPFLRKLRTALTEIVAMMEKDALLELDEAKRNALVSELVAAAAEARSPAHLLRQVATTLVHSENIDEVYASDEEIEHYLKKKLA